MLAMLDSAIRTWNLYVNGNLEAQATGPQITQSTGGLALGRKGQSSVHSDFYQGLLDDTRIYNQALTPAQVQALYAAGAGSQGGNVVQGNRIGTNPAGTAA